MLALPRNDPSCSRIITAEPAKIAEKKIRISAVSAISVVDQ
jgi:hypothetical protein